MLFSKVLGWQWNLKALLVVRLTCITSACSYSMEDIYEVVADVEEYKNFVPWCRNSTVLSRKPGYLKSKLEVGFPPLYSEKYSSSVTLVPPNLVKVRFHERGFFWIKPVFWRCSPFLPPSLYNVGSVHSKCSPWSNICMGGGRAKFWKKLSSSNKGQWWKHSKFSRCRYQILLTRIVGLGLGLPLGSSGGILCPQNCGLIQFLLVLYGNKLDL